MSSTETKRTGNRARTSVKELRSFGFVVGGIFGVIGLWPLVVRGAGARWWALALAGVLIGPAVLAPQILAPAHRLWMGLAEVLAWVNTRILLSIVFFGMVTPMGTVMRWFGRDPMRRGFDRDAATYRVDRQPRPATHMLRQF